MTSSSLAALAFFAGVVLLASSVGNCFNIAGDQHLRGASVVQAPQAAGQRRSAPPPPGSDGAEWPTAATCAAAVLACAAAARLAARRAPASAPPAAPSSALLAPLAPAVTAAAPSLAAAVVPVAAKDTEALGAALPPALLSGHASQEAPGAFCSARRGSTEASGVARGARVAMQVRNGRGMNAVYRRHDMWLKFSKHFHGRKRNCYRLAKEGVMKALKHQYVNRRQFKRSRRTLWIMRVKANSRLHGIPYSTFICKLKESNIMINRKILSQLGIYDRPVFTNIMDIAVPDWAEIKEKKYAKPKEMTVQQMDDAVIPYLEQSFPGLYTDDCIRFNRKAYEWGVNYTIDMGKPEDWREMLPKTPELANFELPDHWMQNANTQHESMPVELLDQPEEALNPKFLKFRAAWEQDEKEELEKRERGEPTKPRKEGINREDWFKEEPQSWY